MQLPHFISHASSHEKPRDLASLEMAQAIGGVALPDRTIDPVVLDLQPGERPSYPDKWTIEEGDRIAESRVDEDLYPLYLRDWRARNKDTERLLTRLVDMSFGINSENRKKVDDKTWAERYDKELSLIKRDFPNPKPVKPGIEVK